MLGIDIEKVIRMSESGISVVTAAVRGDEVFVFAGPGIFRGPEEEQMFQEMRQTFPARRVRAAAYVYVQ